ncbi:MAG: ABC transporter ATP-binding protein [Candidatus Omnitrophota bacterium]|jgi:ABC-type sugar transport system ATPase subunit|nr:MAG: ABC transporter ATP-binding protein [Candidatus Omnitrophota bacterium]
MIRIENLSIRQGHFSLDHIHLQIDNGRYGVLMGKTGTGKTTILEAICGLKQIAGGRIELGNRDVTHLKPALRGVGFVPQDGALFTHMTIRENLAFALAIRKRPQSEIQACVTELADLLGLEKLMDRTPHGLSGGEKQRVSLGRALAAHPTILCLDEPLSALDDETRQEMYVLLRSVRERTGVTTLHITHNLHEATMLADVVFLLKNGTIRQISPAEIA